MLTWYQWTTALYRVAEAPLAELATGSRFFLLSSILLGLLGSLAPCQLTTNATAAAYVVARGGTGRQPLATALAYVLGKAVVYTALGLTVMLAGAQAGRWWSIPAAGVARRLAGPLMLAVGLYLLGVWRLRFSLKVPGAARLERWVATRRGAPGAFGLGLLYGLAFCPTLLVLFFGLVIPTALGAPVGWLAPAGFAVGTAVPVLLAAALLDSADGDRPLVSGRRGRRIQQAAGLVMILAGAHDTLLYWLL